MWSLQTGFASLNFALPGMESNKKAATRLAASEPQNREDAKTKSWLLVGRNQLQV
jgi:hypothetical protein